jgi:hypothetical protein
MSTLTLDSRNQDVEIRDQLAKDCFVRAVNDSKIQLSIFQREPKTIDDCVRFGLEYEAFNVDQKRLNNPKQGVYWFKT